jgi:hypothetical protein
VLFENRQRTLLLVFTFRKDSDRVIELFELATNFREFIQGRADLKESLPVMTQYKIVFAYRAKQIRQLLNALLTPNKELRSALIADKVRLTVLGCSLFELLST